MNRGNQRVTSTTSDFSCGFFVGAFGWGVLGLLLLLGVVFGLVE
jgi:hypothetical protein